MGVAFGPVASAFIQSDAPVSVIVGPVGSGKSSATVIKLMRLILGTPPGADGVSRSRTIIVRNTYRELEDSVIKTFFAWVPQSSGEWSPGSLTWRLDVPGRCQHNVMFRSFDSAGDVGKLLSTEYSYGMLSEARELPEELIHMLPARLRYPTQRDVPGFRGRVLIESNPSDQAHWLYRQALEQKTEGWQIFEQPSGLAANAENLENLPTGYYESLIAGRPLSWVDCFVHGKWVFHSSDLAVFPEWINSRHVSARPLAPVPGAQVIVGLDFGLTPAAAFIQRGPSGQYQVISEIVTDNMGAARFAAEIKHELATQFAGCEAEIWGDPAGEQRAQTDETTPYQILAKGGINAMPVNTNDWTTRRETVAGLLSSNDMAGNAALVVSCACKVLMRGMAGDFRYARIQVAGTARYSQKPNKSSSSHICDALGYALVGAGEDSRVFGKMWDSALDRKLQIARAEHEHGLGRYSRAGNHKRSAN